MTIQLDHQLGPRPSPLQERALKEAYLALYAFAGAKKADHFIFTSSGAEAVNHAVFSAYLDITRKTGKNHFLCSSLEEAPTILAMSRLQEVGCVFQMVPLGTDGKMSKKEVAEMITPRTAMLSMNGACGLTGVIQPVSEIAELCHERGILFHVEATHILGKGDFTFEESGADLLTFNGSPAGTGGLFFKEKTSISPFILGGGEQGDMRGGTFSASHLIELAKWAKEERALSDHYGMEIARLRALFEALVCEKVASAKPLFTPSARVPHITSFLFPGVTSDALYYLLAQNGVQATLGGNTFQHLVHILKACGIKEPDCHCGLSFGFPSSITEEEVREAASRVAETVLHLQKYGERM